jgi:hypothetical protein
MRPLDGDEIDRIFEDDALIERALRKGVRDALRMHKAAGNPIPDWRDGKLVWIPPEEIVIPDDEELEGESGA